MFGESTTAKSRGPFVMSGIFPIGVMIDGQRVEQAAAFDIGITKREINKVTKCSPAQNSAITPLCGE